MTREKLSAHARRSPQRARLQLEQLEKRELFVVGSNFLPGVEAGFDGVVQVFKSTGGAGSGTLLESGRHILTAAHCVDFDVDTDGDGKMDRGNGIVDAATFWVRFEVGGRTIDYSVPASNVSLRTDWTGDWRQNDIALITLPELAPSGAGNLGADRGALYRSTDEAGKSLTLVGYGSTGSGRSLDVNNDGLILPTEDILAGYDDSFGVRRSGTNRFDSASGGILTLDLDNTAGEVVSAPGDSGGPSYIGGRIAGVTSYGTLKERGKYPDGSAIGATDGYTRVSQHLSFIDGVVGGSYDLVLNMNNQVAGNDGRGDQIQVRANGANLEVLVNGAVIHTDLASNMRSLTVRGSGDDDALFLSTQLPVTFEGGAGSNGLIAPNQTNTWSITGTNQGRIGSWASFSGVQQIKGGTGTDIFSFENGAKITHSVSGGEGVDLLDFQKYTSAVEVNLLEKRWSGAANVNSIENVKGGSGDDVLVGDAGANTLTGYGGNDILDGGDGVDSLYGGNDRDLLIGGAGGDVLEGQGGEDILIGGRLTVSAKSLRSEWIRTDNSYDARVANLRNGTGRNGSARLTSSTVTDDPASDQLTGGGEMDWFWGTGAEAKDREFDFNRNRFELLG